MDMVILSMECPARHPCALIFNSPIKLVILIPQIDRLITPHLLQTLNPTVTICLEAAS